MNTKTKNKRISVLIPSHIADEVSKISELEQKTQSEIINKMFESWFNEKLSQDAKFLSNIKFDDIPTEEEWMAIEPKINDLWK